MSPAGSSQVARGLLSGQHLLAEEPQPAAGRTGQGAARGVAGAQGLAFNEDKTKIVHLNEGFDLLLGFGIRRYPNRKQPITSSATATTTR